MRYEIDENNYILNVYFGCNSGTCTEYTGEIPEGYETLSLWAENANIRAYKLVDGNLILDTVKNEELEAIYAKETEENSCASKKFVNDKIQYSTAVVTDELAIETSGNDLIILTNAGNYEIPELKVRSNTANIVEVVSSNKNILGINGITTTINGVDITINSDGTITLNGEATDYIEYDLNGLIHSGANTEMLFLLKNNMDYAISGLTNNVSLSLYSNDGTDKTLIGNYANEGIYSSNTYKVTQATLNIESGSKFEDVVIAPQIELNKIATEFIKHEETRALGILENNECIITSLVSYLDKTIIMIDNEVECNIQYYRYKYINEKLVEIQVQEDEIKSTVSEITETVEGQNQKISEVSQKVGELNSKITEIADITTSKESFNGTVEIEGINQSEPIYIKVHPEGENISYLYPSANLFPSANLYLKTRILRFTNTTTKEVVDYTLPTDLLYYDAENYDEFVLDYDMQSCLVNKRVGYNADGSTYVLEKPTTIEYEYPKIVLNDGDYTVTLLNYDNAYLFVRLMAQNIYTTQFATKAEMHSTITQTVEEIDLSVDRKLDLYSTTEEMNSAINVKADSITSSVSRTYATKTENANTLNAAQSYADEKVTTAKSEIKQTTDSISSEVSKKVGNDEIISKINQSAETVQIDANKISLNGKTINLTGDNTVIKSNNFNVDANGNMTCSNANITGGKINVLGNGDGADVIKITSITNSDEYTSLMPMGLTSFGTNGSVDVFCSGSNSDSSHVSLYDQDGYAYYGTDRIKCMSIFDKQTTSMAPNLRVDSTGEFLRSTNTSSKRYKTNIKDVEKAELDVHKLYDLPVRQFKYKKDYFKNKEDNRYDTELIGFIAEEVAEIYPIATDYEKDENGNRIIENWNERYIIPAMLKLIQEQHEDIKQLQKEIKELKESE